MNTCVNNIVVDRSISNVQMLKILLLVCISGLDQFVFVYSTVYTCREIYHDVQAE